MNKIWLQLWIGAVIVFAALVSAQAFAGDGEAKSQFQVIELKDRMACPCDLCSRLLLLQGRFTLLFSEGRAYLSFGDRMRNGSKDAQVSTDYHIEHNLCQHEVCSAGGCRAEDPEVWNEDEVENGVG